MESNLETVKKIIIIDDDEDLLYTFNHWLLNKSFLTIAATDTDEIDTLIAGFAPDLILIDIKLKSADGRDVCRYIKQDLRFNQPVLLFSAYEYEERSILRSLADGFFIKTSDHSMMIKQIMKYL